MNNTTVYAVVEGQTEQAFVDNVLAPYLGHFNVFIYARLIGKPGHKGGNVRFERVRKDIEHFLKQRRDTYITTMFDYFRLPYDWPGRGEMPANLSTEEKANRIEQAALKELKRLFPEHNPEARLIPYIQMHEFEALLFSDISILSDGLGIQNCEIERILNECGGHEEINEGIETAPSKRLERLCLRYNKVVKGKSISEQTGLETIRKRCPHFDSWLRRMEKLARQK
ncbi:hypothetical protein L21SP3_01960 [Sedimentisphaera cyanobacteriorum]|uniref:DUF4276 domain-containing protein n=1 Tax=Sedimentisphaera cyanobacteriorum TaxID=1940790 RepID=A0A1Q2HS87_9BACT|nr:DUF4276 family protein [Sedimentisphaera cyanobacteriorum]AQQ10134.1 hypothetical protein L21SP3_01960 [Sedimentisphaera cyanobacteriorum]